MEMPTTISGKTIILSRKQGFAGRQPAIRAG
jgi:hypothetical protein